MRAILHIHHHRRTRHLCAMVRWLPTATFLSLLWFNFSPEEFSLSGSNPQHIRSPSEVEATARSARQHRSSNEASVCNGTLTSNSYLSFSPLVLIFPQRSSFFRDLIPSTSDRPPSWKQQQCIKAVPIDCWTRRRFITNQARSTSRHRRARHLCAMVC